MMLPVNLRILVPTESETEAAEALSTVLTNLAEHYSFTAVLADAELDLDGAIAEITIDWEGAMSTEEASVV